MEMMNSISNCLMELLDCRSSHGLAVYLAVGYGEGKQE